MVSSTPNPYQFSRIPQAKSGGGTISDDDNLLAVPKDRYFALNPHEGETELLKYYKDFMNLPTPKVYRMHKRAHQKEITN